MELRRLAANTASAGLRDRRHEPRRRRSQRGAEIGSSGFGLLRQRESVCWRFIDLEDEITQPFGAVLQERTISKLLMRGSFSRIWSARNIPSNGRDRLPLPMAGTYVNCQASERWIIP